MTVIWLLCVSNRQQNLCAKEQRKSGIYITYAHKCNQFQSKSYLVSFARNLIPSSDKFNFGLQPLTIFLLVYGKAASIRIDMQSWTFAYKRLLNKPYNNEIVSRGQNLCLICCKSLELMLYFGKGLRSVHTGNISFIERSKPFLKWVKAAF